MNIFLVMIELIHNFSRENSGQFRYSVL